MEFEKICGLKVDCIKGRGFRKYLDNKVEPMYILFSDEKTFIELAEQEYEIYHDASRFARELTVIQDGDLWREIKEKYPAANIDIQL